MRLLGGQYLVQASQFCTRRGWLGPGLRRFPDGFGLDGPSAVRTTGQNIALSQALVSLDKAQVLHSDQDDFQLRLTRAFLSGGEPAVKQLLESVGTPHKIPIQTTSPNQGAPSEQKTNSKASTIKADPENVSSTPSEADKYGRRLHVDEVDLDDLTADKIRANYKAPAQSTSASTSAKSDTLKSGFVRLSPGIQPASPKQVKPHPSRAYNEHTADKQAAQDQTGKVPVREQNKQDVKDESTKEAQEESLEDNRQDEVANVPDEATCTSDGPERVPPLVFESLSPKREDESAQNPVRDTRNSESVAQSAPDGLRTGDNQTDRNGSSVKQGVRQDWGRMDKPLIFTSDRSTLEKPRKTRQVRLLCLDGRKQRVLSADIRVPDRADLQNQTAVRDLGQVEQLHHYLPFMDHLTAQGWTLHDVGPTFVAFVRDSAESTPQRSRWRFW